MAKFIPNFSRSIAGEVVITHMSTASLILITTDSGGELYLDYSELDDLIEAIEKIKKDNDQSN